MAPSGANVLREWSHAPPSSIGKTPTDNPEEIPVMATLVPTIYRKSNVLFQDAYGRLGHHLNSSFGMKSNVDENSIPPSRHVWMADDELEQGEVHIINGESIEVSLSEDNDVDDYIHEYKNNRRNAMSKFRHFIGRGKGKEKKGGSFRRNRKGSRDKTLKGKKMNEARREGMFPVQMDEEGKKSKRWNRKHKRNQWTANVSPVAFAQPCVRLGAQVERLRHPDTAASAPKRQNMSRAGSRAVLSRAASSHLDMKDAKCIPDCEISELADTDIFDEDRRSLYHSYTDTDTVVAATPPRSDIKSTLSYEEQEPNLEEEEEEGVSFHSFLEQTKTVLKENVNVSALRRTKHEISNTLTQKRSSYTKAQSMPNVLRTRSIEDENRGTVEKRIKDYESRLHQITLSSQLQCPASPRKVSRTSSDQTQVGLNSPPQHVFKNSIFHRSQKAGLTRREVAQTPKVKHNDTLKVVLVGSPNAGKSSLVTALTKKSKKKPKNRKSVDINVQTWSPAPAMGSRDVKFNLWDIQGGNFEDGVHHSTQSLFFSSNTLYVLVWNMSINNSSIVDLNSSDHSLGSEYDDSDDYFDEELKSGKRDKLIQRDIDENVMYWIELLSTSELSDYAILPVVTFKDHFDDDEVERRCNLLMQRLQSDLKKGSRFPEVILDSKGGIPKLSSTEEGGIAELEQCLRNVVHSRDGADSVFKNHLESKLCAVTSSVQNILHMFRGKGLKVVHIEDITRQFLENPSIVENFSNSLVTKALRFLSSIGNIMYFDVSKRTCTRPRYLEDYVVLCPNWISTALSLGLRWDPVDSPLAEMRKTSKSKDSETGIWKFGKSFPLFSHEDSVELWSNMNFVKRANKRLSEDGSVVPNTSNDLYHFLQQVCEYSGIFVPFTLTTRNRRKQSYYLVPMIADQVVPTESWSYKVKDESMTTLCHTFAPSGAISSGFMDKIAVEVMRSVFEFSFQHSSTSMRIQQVLFWKNAIYVKVIEEIEDENNKKRSCAAEFFVQMAKIDSPHYVGSDDFRKLIVSAKGYAGVHGEKIWKQGFSSVLESIERIANIHVEGPLKREIVCPDCLRQTTAINATVWDCEDIKYSDDAIVCPHGHILHPQLLLGAFDEMDDAASVATVATGVNSVYSSFSTYSTYTSTSYRTADVMIPAVVLVALWDRASDRIINVGSGFVADNKRGLIVTAAHVLFNFEADTGYKKYKQFFGLPNATALIGVNHQGNDSAVFTYCADIVASDVYNVDGCILRIKSKFERPVELDRNFLTHRAEIPLSSQSEIKQERLERLVMTTLSPRQQEVRVLGYRQTGEGIMVAGRYINRTACVNVGYVCKPAKSNDLQTKNEFVPRSEVIVNCSTGGGNSGGPFVNELGEVIGILSRTDHIDKNRCYLTAALELKILLKEARKKCKREKVVFSPLVNL